MSIRTRFNPLGTIGRKALLPAGYIELEYLESTGTQYITVPYTFLNHSKFAAKLDMQAVSNDFYGLMGFSGSAGQWFRVDSNRFEIGAAVYTTSVNPFIRGKITQQIDRAGTVYTANFQAGNESVSRQLLLNETPQSYGLFGTAIPYTAQPGYHCGSIRLFSAEIRVDDVLKHRLIPALDPAGRPCMFDTVTRQPFYNQGTGEFQYGAKWLPAGYNGVYGVYFNGSTIVDSGILATTNYDITTRFKVNLTGSGDAHIFSARGTTDQRLFYASIYTGTGFYFGRSSNTTVRVYADGEYTWHSVFTTSDNHGELNGTPYRYTAPIPQYSFPFTMYIGGINSNISPILVSSPFTLRSLSVRDSSTRRLLGDFVPCVNNSTGVYGIYDKVTKNLMPVVQGALMAEQ